MAACIAHTYVRETACSLIAFLKAAHQERRDGVWPARTMRVQHILHVHVTLEGMLG